MKAYLYLLPFNDGKFFKIGISTNNDNRVKCHNSTYGIDLEKSYIITAKQSRMIKALETELLCLFPKPTVSKYSGSDGHTEIRNIKHFNKVVEYIKSKPELFDFNIFEYYDFFKPKVSIINKNIIDNISIDSLIRDNHVSAIKIGNTIGIKIAIPKNIKRICEFLDSHNLTDRYKIGDYYWIYFKQNDKCAILAYTIFNEYSIKMLKMDISEQINHVISNRCNDDMFVFTIVDILAPLFKETFENIQCKNIKYDDNYIAFDIKSVGKNAKQILYLWNRLNLSCGRNNTNIPNIFNICNHSGNVINCVFKPLVVPKLNKVDKNHPVYNILPIYEEINEIFKNKFAC